MTTATQTRFQMGDLVTPVPGMFSVAMVNAGPYKITKVPVGPREKNYVAMPVEGNGRGIRAPGYALAPYDNEAPARHADGGLVFLDVGTVVTVEHPKFKPADLYVVIGSSRKGGNRLVKLGGDGGRYWPSIPTTLCTVVDPESITVR